MSKAGVPRLCVAAFRGAGGPTVDSLAVGRHGAVIHLWWEVFEYELVEFVAEVSKDGVVRGSPKTGGGWSGIPPETTPQEISQRNQVASERWAKRHVADGDDPWATGPSDLDANLAVPFNGYLLVPRPHEVARVGHLWWAFETAQVVDDTDRASRVKNERICQWIGLL